MPMTWPTPTDLLTYSVAFGSAALGAFLGSLSAYLLGRRQHRSDERDKYYGYLLAAQYSLMSQWNILEGIRRQHLEPLRDDPTRFVKLPVFYAPSHHYPVPFEHITRITRSSNPNLLQDVHIAEQRYHTSQESLAIRNKLLEAFYKNPNEDFDFDTGRGRVRADAKEVYFIRQATDVVYQQIDRALPALAETARALERFIKAEFKGAKPLRMQGLDDTPKGLTQTMQSTAPGIS
jgi:hypothetical protein